MKSISLYVQGNSPIHKMYPTSKIAYILAAIAVPAIIPVNAVALTCLSISVLGLLWGKVFRKVLPLISFSMVVLLSVIIIQGLFKLDNKTPLFHIGPLVFYKEGLAYALGICIRVTNILCAFAVLILTTKPSDLVEALVKKGLSSKIGYVLSSVLQIIPQMTATMGTITDAQRSRGMETEGRLRVRIKAFFPLIGPVVMNSLVSTRERAMALEVRGFDSKTKKTFLSDAEESAQDKLIQGFLILSVVLAIVWRVVA